MITTESGPEASARLGEVLFEARGVSKLLSGIRTLEGVDLILHTGEVHAPVGENGAGKSVLIRTLSGLYQPDEGEVLMQGEPIILSTPLAAQQTGISAIRQELFLMNYPTMIQNMFISRKFRLLGDPLNHKRLNNDAAELLEKPGVKIDPRVQVGRLTVISQQPPKVAKAPSFNLKVLTIDESMATLNDAEVEMLFQIMDGLTGSGTGTVHISHRMEEIHRKSTRIIVLRDGRSVDSRPGSEVTILEIIQLIVGRKLASDVQSEPHGSTEMVFDVKELSTAELFKDASFHLERGGILGFAGLVGVDHAEVARTLIDTDPRVGDIITVGNRQADIYSPRGAVKIGISHLSEGRKRYGLVLQQDVAANIAPPSLRKFFTGGLPQDDRMRKAARGRVKTLAMKTPSARWQARNFSGGNQQRVVPAKWLERDRGIPVLDEPTRGIDVGAEQEIYDPLDELTNQGESTVMIFPEMEEVLRMSDRIAVMCNDRITGFLPNTEATQEKIIELVTQLTTTETTNGAS